jgi:hypothetical protein
MSWLEEETNILGVSSVETPILPDTQDVEVEEIDAPAQEDAEITPDRRVVFGGREFVIEEPDTATILGMLNWVGMLGVRANRFTGQSFKGLFMEETKDGKKSFVPPAETTLFAMLSVVTPGDIGRIAVLALFGGGKEATAEGNEFVKSLPEREFKIGPLVKALSYRIALADDLRDALKNLQVGAALTSLLQTNR